MIDAQMRQAIDTMQKTVADLKTHMEQNPSRTVSMEEKLVIDIVISMKVVVDHLCQHEQFRIP